MDLMGPSVGSLSAFYESPASTLLVSMKQVFTCFFNLTFEFFSEMNPRI